MPTLAQSPVTYQYAYDDAGRVTHAIDSSGNALVYTYDAAGNILSIAKQTGVTVAIFGATDANGNTIHAAKIGQTVTLTGVGLGDCPTVTVTVDGITATITGKTTNTITIIIPAGATTGQIVVNTCHGSASFLLLIGGVIVTPPQATLTPSQTVQFTAAVLPSGGNQSVTWSVDGIAGGAISVGTVSSTGLYTAPPAASGSVDVRATSVAHPTLYGDAQVTILNPNDAYEAFSPGVSVRIGAGTGGTGTNGEGTVYILAPPVSVAVGVAGANAGRRSPERLAVNPGITLQHLDPTISGNSVVLNVMNPDVSTQGGLPKTNFLPTRTVPLSRITALSPSQLAPGATGVVTVAGTHLEGTQAVAFLDDTGHLDTHIRIQKAAVAPDGRAITLHLTVSHQAPFGPRRVVVWTLPAGKSTAP